MYEHHRLAVSNGVAQVKKDVPFRVVVANFSNVNKQICRHQVIANVLPHPKAMVATCLQLDPLLAAEFSVPPHDQQEVFSDTVEVDTTLSTLPSVEDVNLEYLPSDARETVLDMLRQYSEMRSGKLGEVTATEHPISLKPSSKLFRSQPYRSGPTARVEIQKAIDEMEAEGVISKSQSEWASPVVLVSKPDGSLRFCVDYRRLNAMTERDTYPIPRMDDCIDSLGEAKWFTTLDCNSGYWQIPISVADRARTAFTSHAGIYQFDRMPFWLMNVPATFQRTLDILLSHYRWKSCLIYLDDIIIFSKDFDTHVQDVRNIFTGLQSAGLSLKLRKCHFFKDFV